MSPRLFEPGTAGERLREFPILADEFLLGRGSDCDLRLHDNAISRHHCLIRVRGHDVSISDLGSANGTYVNGARMTSQTALHTGDEIRVGDCRYVIDLGDDPEWSQRYLNNIVDPATVTTRRLPHEIAKKLDLDH